MIAAYKNSASQKLTDEESSRLLTQISKQTFGDLIKTLSKSVEVPSELANRLEKARVARNRLAHTYLSERSNHFQTEAGRSEMIRELDEIGDQMHELYNYLDNVIVG